MKARTPILISRCIAWTLVMLATGCRREESATPNKSAISKGSLVPAAAPHANGVNADGPQHVYLPSSGILINDPVSLWVSVEAFRNGINKLSNEQFIEATQEMLRLRSELGKQKKLNSLVVAARVEDIVSNEMARRINNGNFFLSEAKQVLAGYLAPVFNKELLVELIGYREPVNPETNEQAHSITGTQLRDFAFEQSGGDDGLFDDVPENPHDSWFLESKKPIFKLGHTYDARHRIAALQGYLIFLQRGGDATRQPLYKHIQEIIPDILNQPVIICPGLADGVLDAGDVERLAGEK